MSGLPEQLRKQVSMAETFYTKEAEKPGDPKEASTAETSGDAPTTDPILTVEPSEVVQNTALSGTDENTETYAQRWRSQQGIVASLNQKLGYAEQRANQLEALISNMQQAIVEPAPVAKKHLTDKDREEYGADMVDFISRAVSEGTDSLREENQALRQELSQIKGVVPAVQRLNQQQQVSREDSFWGALSANVTDWQDVNADQRFRSWLLEADPMTGITRDVYLKDAQRDLDVNRVANIFNNWKQQFSVPSNTKADDNRTATRNELEMQLSPGSRTGNSTSTTLAQPKKWSNADIGKFYDDVRKGVFKGREAEMRQTELGIYPNRGNTA